MRFATCRFMPLVILAVFGAALPSTSATIYFDDFNGSSGTDLAGTAPDVRPGSETWASGTADTGIPGVLWKADGSVLASTTGGGGVSAVLPFSPASGNIYELSVRLNPTRTDGSGDWLALGFGTVTGSLPGSGAPWVYKRGDGLFDTASLLGPGVGGIVSHGSPTGLQPSPTDFRIVLNTTALSWTAEWFIDNTSVRTATYSTNPTITHVGIFRYESAAGSAGDFQLTVIPEPGTAMLFGLGLAGLAVRQRKGA